MIADPRLREDDEEGFRHVRVGEHPLEGCTRILVGACPEQGRMGRDDKKARSVNGLVGKLFDA